ncbi:MAG: fibronectin type III domain-containing protein, partial [Atopobiaceae bacterium]|nr:fibronectin type III domain-containing protein [Atopobiaceae bacterium]
EATYIMVAKQAYVHEPQDSGESSEAQSGSSEAAPETQPSEPETQPAASEGAEEPQTRPAPSPNGGTTVQTMDEENGTVDGGGTQTETPATEGPANTDTGGTDTGGTDTGGTSGTETGGTDTGGTETGGNDTAGADTAGTDAGGTGAGNTDQGAAGNTEGASGNTFLDNTRFQILFDQPQGGGGINASDLRWVHTVIVHMKGAEPAPKLIGELKPTIDYTPVPQGMVAFLTAVPPTAIGSTTFGYKWERSKDEGKTWKVVGSDTQQTIQVTTDGEHIGNWYRVSVITDSGLSEPSDHVVIKTGSGLSVQLDYIPPIAGDWANFTSHVIGPSGNEINDSSIEYKWQQSTDGGSSWQDIPNEKGKTLSVKTNPVSGGGSGGGDASLTYIRVVAVYNSQSLISNRQLLTVRVGESDGHSSEETGKDEKTNDIENAMNGGNANQTPDTATPAPSSEQANVKVTAIDITPGADYADEDVDADDLEEGYFDDEEEATEQKPVQEDKEKPKESTDVTDVVVDKRVSEIIMEQNNKDSQNKAATPGARWTEISAVNASQDDIRRVLAGNPFAPLAAPFALGITAAGLVEKLVAFRRQIF